MHEHKRIYEVDMLSVPIGVGGLVKQIPRPVVYHRISLRPGVAECLEPLVGRVNDSPLFGGAAETVLLADLGEDAAVFVQLDLEHDGVRVTWNHFWLPQFAGFIRENCFPLADFTRLLEG